MPDGLNRKTNGPVIFVALSLVLALPVIYFGSYFALGDERIVDAVIRVRTFESDWLATIYFPAGRAEEFIRRMHVVLEGPDNP